MKKILEDKILLGMIIFILLELIIIIIICKMQDLAALATIITAILIYLTLRETSNSNKKQLEMQTKIHLYEKRMKFREELTAFSKNCNSNLSHVFTMNQTYRTLYREIINLPKTHFVDYTGKMTKEEAKQARNKKKEQKLEIINKLFNQISPKGSNEEKDWYLFKFDDLSLVNTNSDKLLLDATLLFNNYKVITDYIDLVKKRIELFIEAYNINIYPLLYRLWTEEDLTKQGLLLCEIIKKSDAIVSASREYYEKDCEEWVRQLPKSPNIEEVDKAIQEEAKLIS